MADKPKSDQGDLKVQAGFFTEGRADKVLVTGLLCLGLALLIGRYRERSNVPYVTGAVASKHQSPRRKDPPVCADASTYALEQDGIAVPVSLACMSGLVFPRVPIGFMRLHGPGDIRVCLWNNDRCVGWIHTANHNYQQKERRDLPHYQAFRLIGDPGTAFLEVIRDPR